MLNAALQLSEPEGLGKNQPDVMNPNYRKKCYYKFWDREGFSLAERALYFISWLKTHDHVGSANKHIQ